MRKIIVSEWITLDGVFDAAPQYFNKWFTPYDSEARAAYIQKTILGCGGFLMGGATYNTLAPYWSALKNNEFGLADKMNSVPKYVVSTTLEKADWSNTQRCAILGVGRIKQQPVMNGDKIVGRYLVWLSLTFDHRLVDGAPAARFLQRVGQLVERPYLLIT